MAFRNVLLLTVAAALAACGASRNIQEPQHWQRIGTSESIYQQGPKAEQMLDRDIGRCVVELQELQSLGAVKNPVPTDSTGRVLGPDETRKAGWTPSEHDGSFVPTDGNFQDFNGCMESKGWERIYAAGTSAMQTSRALAPQPE